MNLKPMFKLFSQLFAVAIVVTAVALIFWQSFTAQPVRSEMANISPPPLIVATAAAPPQLTTARLGGKSVYVLYITQSTDPVLVRCYPGYEPTIVVRTMGSNPKAKGQKEGVMTCRPGT
jgi:hypothetical protein